MSITFPFKEETSSVFGHIKRPLAEVQFLSEELQINLKNDTRRVLTAGVGGNVGVFLLNRRMKIRIGNYEKHIIIGFSDNNFIPPLLGRYTVFDTFRVVFDKYTTTFSATM